MTFFFLLLGGNVLPPTHFAYASIAGMLRQKARASLAMNGEDHSSSFIPSFSVIISKKKFIDVTIIIRCDITFIILSAINVPKIAGTTKSKTSGWLDTLLSKENYWQWRLCLRISRYFQQFLASCSEEDTKKIPY